MPQLTIDLNDDLYQELTEFCTATGQSPQDAVEILLVDSISDAHFSEIVAPRDYFERPSPLTQAEADTAMRKVAQPILEAAEGSVQRREIIIYGLIHAAYAQTLALCKAKGSLHPGQHADFLFAQMIHAEARARRGRTQDDE